MTIKNSIDKYLLGSITGILLVIGCSGGGSGGISNVGAASITGITAQLFCSGFPEIMSGASTGNVTCTSSTSSTPQTFQNFNQITQQGWILVEVSAPGSGSSFIFQK